MEVATTTTLTERVIAILRVHEAKLCYSGIRCLSLFGSVARGDAQAGSDVDLAAKLDLTARIDLVRLVAVEPQLAEILGYPVDLLPELVEKLRLRVNIERDRVRAF